MTTVRWLVAVVILGGFSIANATPLTLSFDDLTDAVSIAGCGGTVTNFGVEDIQCTVRVPAGTLPNVPFAVAYLTEPGLSNIISDIITLEINDVGGGQKE